MKYLIKKGIEKRKKDDLHTFVVIQELFGKYRNVERGDVIVRTWSVITTGRLSQKIIV